jgi:hypothetical protein
MARTLGNNTFLQRLIGAMALDAAIYEEVEADRMATGQAFLVVLLSSVAAGIGARGVSEQSVVSIVFFSIVALMSWASWALMTFVIGTLLLPEPETRSDVGELLRTIGFASAPGLLRVLGVLPGVTLPVFIGTGIWMLIATIVAVRQALDYRSTARAVGVCALGWVLSVLLAILLGSLLGPSVS